MTRAPFQTRPRRFRYSSLTTSPMINTPGPRASGATVPAGGIGGQLRIAPSDLAAVYENAPFMVAVTLGPRHVYSFVNRLAAQVSGRSAESLVGRSVREVYPDLEPRFESALDQVYATGRPWSAGDADVHWVHVDGGGRDARANLMFQPLRDAEGRVVGLLHIGAEA